MKTTHAEPFDSDWSRIASYLNGAPVAALTGGEFPRTDEGDLLSRVSQWFQSQHQGGVTREDVGRITLNKRGVKSSMGHGLGRMKAVAFAAVPVVIQKGIICERQEDWKQRGYDSVTFAAPILIGGDVFIIVVIVHATQGEFRFYLHEAFPKKELQQGAFKTGASASEKSEVELPGAPVGAIKTMLQSFFAVNPENDGV